MFQSISCLWVVQVWLSICSVSGTGYGGRFTRGSQLSAVCAAFLLSHYNLWFYNFNRLYCEFVCGSSSSSQPPYFHHINSVTSQTQPSGLSSSPYPVVIAPIDRTWSCTAQHSVLILYWTSSSVQFRSSSFEMTSLCIYSQGGTSPH